MPEFDSENAPSPPPAAPIHHSPPSETGMDTAAKHDRGRGRGRGRGRSTPPPLSPRNPTSRRRSSSSPPSPPLEGSDEGKRNVRLKLQYSPDDINDKIVIPGLATKLAFNLEHPPLLPPATQNYLLPPSVTGMDTAAKPDHGSSSSPPSPLLEGSDEGKRNVRLKLQYAPEDINDKIFIPGLATKPAFNLEHQLSLPPATQIYPLPPSVTGMNTAAKPDHGSSSSPPSPLLEGSDEGQRNVMLKLQCSPEDINDKIVIPGLATKPAFNLEHQPSLLPAAQIYPMPPSVTGMDTAAKPDHGSSSSPPSPLLEGSDEGQRNVMLKLQYSPEDINDKITIPGPVAVFWDLENCHVPKTGVVQDMHVHLMKALSSHYELSGQLQKCCAYADFNLYPPNLLEKLIAAGFETMHVPHNNKKEAVDKRMITDMMFFALDHPNKSAAIMVISGDSDFAYSLSGLRQRGYTTALAIQAAGGFNSELVEQADFLWDWSSLAHGKGQAVRRFANTEVLKQEIIQLLDNFGSLPISDISREYLNLFAKPLVLSRHGLSNFDDFLEKWGQNTFLTYGGSRAGRCITLLIQENSASPQISTNGDILYGYANLGDDTEDKQDDVVVEGTLFEVYEPSSKDD